MIENQTDVQTDTEPRAAERRASKLPLPAIDEAETAVELGIWLSGLESFLAAGNYSFSSIDGVDRVSDTAKEFQLTKAALLRCAGLNSRLLLRQDISEQTLPATGREMGDLANVFRDSLLINDCMIRSGSVGIAEWKSWSSVLSERLGHLAAFQKLVRAAEAAGEEFLPQRLKEIVSANTDQEHAELAFVLPRFAKVLKWLSIVGRMLDADEPLKPALLIFSSVSEQIHELINSINNRLERFENEEAELFASLDAAAYTASIELKKVYTLELAGVAQLRPSPSIFAKMETAHSLLSEGFQQILTGFAKSIDPTVDAFALFPNFKTKFDWSMVLRRQLYDLSLIVQAAEKDPEKGNIDKMRKAVREFMSEPVRYLFYKDTETIERFVEEILVAKQNKELVPILHRFGAYLDTLFGQVNLRAVLSDQPFNS